MTSSTRLTASGNFTVEDAKASMAALEILSRLEIPEVGRRLDDFLSVHPQYIPYRGRLFRECKFAAAACAIAAYCHSCGELGNSLDIARCVEFGLSREKGSKQAKTRKSARGPIFESASELEDYITVFRYVLMRTKRLAGCGDDCIPTPLRSIAYLMIKKAIKKRPSTNEEFGNTVHLLDELALPLLTAIFEEFSSVSTEKITGQPGYDPRL